GRPATPGDPAAHRGPGEGVGANRRGARLARRLELTRPGRLTTGTVRRVIQSDSRHISNVPNDTRPTQSLDHREEYFLTEEASSGVKGLRTMKRIRIRVRPKVRRERAWVV